MVNEHDDGDSLALRLERLNSRQSLLENQVKSSIDALRHSVDNMQLEVRGSSAKMEEFAGLQFSNAANRATLDEMRQEMSHLSRRMEEWLQSVNAAQDRRWREADASRERWREMHEAENENTRIDLANDIKETRDKVLVWSGIGFAVVLLGGVIVSAVVWGLNLRFESQNASVADVKTLMKTTQDKVDTLIDRQTNVELYLARGSVYREPYEPASTQQAKP